MNWTEATEFIEQVETDHESEIALKQSPIIVFWLDVFTRWPYPYNHNNCYAISGLCHFTLEIAHSQSREPCLLRNRCCNDHRWLERNVGYLDKNLE